MTNGVQTNGTSAGPQSDNADAIDVEVNGVKCRLLFKDARPFIKAKSGADCRFIVAPATDKGLVLLTFGHNQSPDQYAFALEPAFARDLGTMLQQAAAKFGPPAQTSVIAPKRTI
ncbi:MAG: hypothetical protein KA310_03375 [Pseudomonadales bacterium]|nr:hypothetical protein [Pseudomonadales bacterium]